MFNMLVATIGNSSQPVAAIDESVSKTVGRTGDADCVFADDAMMSGRHAEFGVRTDGELFYVRDLGSTNGTYLNEERVDESDFGPGDAVRCGRVFFTVVVQEGSSESTMAIPTSAIRPKGKSDTATPGRAIAPPAGAAPQAASAPASDEPAVSAEESLPMTPAYVAETAMEVNAIFSAELDPAPNPAEPCDEYLQRLLELEASETALKFLSYAMPKRLAISWAVGCIEDVDAINDDDGPVLAAIHQWIEKPEEPVRRNLMQLAEDRGTQSPACWAAIAAFWSFGSMAPETAPAVPPGEDLCGKAIGGAVQLAAVHGPPEAADDRRISFVSRAKEILG